MSYRCIKRVGVVQYSGPKDVSCRCIKRVGVVLLLLVVAVLVARDVIVASGHYYLGFWSVARLLVNMCLDYLLTAVV